MPEAVDLGFAVRQPPAQAIAYFRSKGYAISWDWHDVWQQSHAQAFTVAKATKLEVLRTIRQSADRAITEGITLKQFADELEPRLRKLGWWGKHVKEGPDGTAQLVQLGSHHRLKTIFRQNLASAYNAGRYREQARQAKLAIGARPYWQYVAVLDGRTRDHHRALHGKVFRHDDPIWDTIYPPNGWNCRCRVRTLSDNALNRRGLKVESSKGKLKKFEQQAAVDKTTGEVITEPAVRYVGKDATGRQVMFAPDAGFGYNPGRARPIYDLEGQLPDAIGSAGGRKVALLKPDQKTFKDYGLPSARDLAERTDLPPAPAMLPKDKSVADARRTLKRELLGEQDHRVVTTPIEVVEIHEDLLSHIIEDRSVRREQFSKFISLTLRTPDEIWLSEYQNGYFRKRYFKMFRSDKGKNFLAIVRENTDGTLLWTTFPSSARYFDRHRRGALLYKKAGG